MPTNGNGLYRSWGGHVYYFDVAYTDREKANGRAYVLRSHGCPTRVTRRGNSWDVWTCYEYKLSTSASTRNWQKATETNHNG